MNLFVYTNDVLNDFEEGLIEFLSDKNNDLFTAEYLTADVMTKLLKEKKAICKVLRTESVWHGVTYKEDLNDLESSLKELVDDGKYPSSRF